MACAVGTVRSVTELAGLPRVCRAQYAANLAGLCLKEQTLSPHPVKFKPLQGLRSSIFHRSTHGFCGLLTEAADQNSGTPNSQHLRLPSAAISRVTATTANRPLQRS